MKLQRLTIFLTSINLLLLVVQVSQFRASAQGAGQVLRGRGLEIVDERGQVRAEMTLLPATTTRDGTSYPETVLLRMRDPSGLVRVKMDANRDGSGLLLADDTQQPGLHLNTKGGAFVEVRNKDGRRQVLKP